MLPITNIGTAADAAGLRSRLGVQPPRGRASGLEAGRAASPPGGGLPALTDRQSPQAVDGSPLSAWAAARAETPRAEGESNRQLTKRIAMQFYKQRGAAKNVARPSGSHRRVVQRT